MDTGILLGYAKCAAYAEEVERKYSLLDPANYTVISIVTLGEIYSIAHQRKWGTKKLRELDALVAKIPWIGINDLALVQKYAEIDAFSQGKGTIPLPNGMSSLNMGKNDLWIAVVAAILQGTLITTDGDFDHLNGSFFTVIQVNPK
jgi:predicted nucleic acid-binding protein